MSVPGPESLVAEDTEPSIRSRLRGHCSGHLAAAPALSGAAAAFSGDAVHVSRGRWTKRQKAALRNAYFEEYQAATGKRLEWESFCRDLNDLGLYQALTYLAPTMRKTSIRYLVAKRKRWIRELRGLLEERSVCSTRPD